MPNLQELSFTVDKLWSMRNYECIYGNLGLDYLTSLQKLTVILDYYYCCLEAYVTEVEAGLRHAIDVHPSHPALIFNRINEESARLFWASRKKFRGGSEQNKVVRTPTCHMDSRLLLPFIMNRCAQFSNQISICSLAVPMMSSLLQTS